MRNLMEFGAVPDGKTLCTDAFARAIAACKQSGETLLVPAGRYYTGTINLDGVSMHMNGGARIIGSSDPKDYPPLDYVHSEMGTLRALIVSLHGENMVLDGDGVINLKGSSFYDFDRPIVPETRVPMTPEEIACCTVEHDWRPSQSIFFANIKGLTVRNLSILDAPCWTVSVNSCENVVLSDLYIDTSLRIPNDDGIHICGCNGVLISDCRISSGDDCIALSSITDWNRPCENIVIKNCKLHSCSKAIVIGYQYSLIRNVTVSDVIIRKSNRGLCFMCHDHGGLVEHVRVHNLMIDTEVRPGNWWGNGEAIFLEALPSAMILPPEQDPHRDTPVNYRDVDLSDIACTSENAIGAVGTGSNFEQVAFRNIRVTLKEPEHLHLKGHTFDTAPSPNPVEIPEGCAVYTLGANVAMENVQTSDYRGGTPSIIQKE